MLIIGNGSRRRKAREREPNPAGKFTPVHATLNSGSLQSGEQIDGGLSTRSRKRMPKGFNEWSGRSQPGLDDNQRHRQPFPLMPKLQVWRLWGPAGARPHLRYGSSCRRHRLWSNPKQSNANSGRPFGLPFGCLEHTHKCCDSMLLILCFCV